MKKLLFLLLFPLLISCEKEEEEEVLPVVVTTVSIGEITTNYIYVSIRVENRVCSAKDNLTAGIAWSTAANPVVTGNKQLSTTECVGGDNIKVTGLQPKTKYYLRAFAQTSDGNIVYGGELSATTK